MARVGNTALAAVAVAAAGVGGLSVGNSDPQGGWQLLPPHKVELLQALDGQEQVTIAACLVTRSYAGTEGTECARSAGYVRTVEGTYNVTDAGGCGAGVRTWAGAAGIVGLRLTDGAVTLYAGSDEQPEPTGKPECFDALRDAAWTQLQTEANDG